MINFVSSSTMLRALGQKFASQTKTRCLQLKGQFFHVPKSGLTISEYVDKVQAIIDALAIAHSLIRKYRTLLLSHESRLGHHHSMADLLIKMQENPAFGNEIDLEYDPQAYSSTTIQDFGNDHSWYVDTGATNHITFHSSNLETSIPYQGHETLTIGDSVSNSSPHITAQQHHVSPCLSHAGSPIAYATDNFSIESPIILATDLSPLPNPAPLEPGQLSHLMVTHYKAGIIKPKVYVGQSTFSLNTREPVSFVVALKHKGWSSAMDDEILNILTLSVNYISLFKTSNWHKEPVTGSSSRELNLFITKLNKAFSLEDLGALNYFLRIKVFTDNTGTMHHGLHIAPSERLSLIGSSDADRASCVDDIKFVAGYGVYLGEVLISWSSKKQFGVARSSSASALATNPIYHPRTKHIELDVHFVQNKVLEKKLEIRYVPSHDQVVNCLIKGLTPIRFKFLISKLNVVTSSFHLRGKVKENG
uniref:Uncharacterized protein n=1 Tax=Cannabis sativa TaxID=3483 RepID=A0A803NT14_CANSA